MLPTQFIKQQTNNGEVIVSMRKFKSVIIYITAVFLSLLLAFSVFMALKNANDLNSIIEESVKSQLISIASAARELIDGDAILEYTDENSQDDENYKTTLSQIRALAQSAGVDYIYVLRYVDGKCIFVFDSDTADNAAFSEYEPSEVHQAAFNGENSAGVMNVVDEWGSFNSGAIPVYDSSGKIAAVVSVDIRDTYLVEGQRTTIINTIMLVGFLIIMIAVTFIVIYVLTRKLNKLQLSLEKMALYDSVTGLPNRQYLFDYLAGITKKNKGEPYAILFIDLDNFKKVNDTAGHDAGDELLHHISSFLENFGQNTVSFRPSAGRLNISARVGGDEFIQVVAGIETVDQADELGKQLIKEFIEKVDNRLAKKCGVGLSVGIALYPYHSDNCNVLIKYSDIAMYHAKQSGKNRSVVYYDEMSNTQEK